MTNFSVLYTSFPRHFGISTPSVYEATPSLPLSYPDQPALGLRTR